LLPLPGTPVLGSLLREYSGLRDAEDSLEFYPAQASQSFFSLPRSLRPRNRLGRTRVEDKTSADAPDRESSQQRQGARRAEEMGR
ncbi:hypothetical protein Taro_047332, partial [Colocasia esculenta]|nr:hypothetical protein [Colocasia esculenta]